MRIRNKVVVRIADDADMSDKLFDTDEDLAEIINDGLTKMTSGKVSVAGGATESINLGDISSVVGIFLKIDQECTIAINGLAPQQVKLPTVGKPAKLYFDMAITSIAITSPANIITNVVFAAWGDPAA